MTEQNPEVPEFDVTSFSDADLTAEYERVRARGQELSARETHTAEEAEEFATLGERLPQISAEIQARAERAQEDQARRDAFASAPELSIPSVTPVVAPQTASEPSEAPVVPSVSQMAVQPPVAPPVPVEPEGVRTTAYVSPMAAGLLNVPVDSVYADNGQIALALIKNAGQFGVKGAPGTTQTVAQFRREGREHVVDTLDGRETMSILRAARRERNLYGGSLAKAWQKAVDQTGSLTAAAGWCAPSQNDYDLCRNWDSPVGILDLPTVTVTRGGINYTDEPTFPEIYANAVAAGGGSNFLTEAQVIADTAKTCSEIPCPTFENRRLDVMALCIRVSFLQAAGYPEVVEAWEDGLRAAHEAEMNRLIIADIIARAGAATVIDSFGADDDSFTSGLLAALELAAVDTRYRFHMSPTATVETMLPFWVIAQIRADLSRRTGDTGGLLNVTDSYIASLFTNRNIRVHWVRGWQDGLITGGALNPAYPGGIAAPPFLTALPQTGLQFVTWPVGSVAVARQDVVTLTNVYDAASLAQNEFTALFAEEGFAPIYPCPGQRLYTVNDLCVGGITGAADIHCSNPVAAA